MNRKPVTVAEAMKNWLEAQENKEQTLMLSGGQSYTAQELITELEAGTEFGKHLEESILQLTIDLLMRKKEGPLDVYDDAPSLEKWEELYSPLDLTDEGQETFMPFKEARAEAAKLNPENPHFHMWTRMDSDDGEKLILSNGVRVVNNLDFCVCAKPWGDTPDRDIYIEVLYHDMSEMED